MATRSAWRQKLRKAFTLGAMSGCCCCILEQNNPGAISRRGCFAGLPLS